MTAYNWTNLSSQDFEAVCQDVMQTILGVRVEMFPPGPDGGIDLRGTGDQGGTLGQCKHFIASGPGKLRTKLLEERSKLDAMEDPPQRYLVFTSVGLTAHQKKGILDDLKPYLLGVDDIYGLQDLETIILRNKEIEARNYKLWLSSISVIEAILGNPIQARSYIRLADPEMNLRTFVEVGDVNKALKILNDNHSLIISGEPGVGKTTLAEMLAYKAIVIGYTVSYVINVEDIEKVYKRGQKQLFIYDDFLGRATLSEMGLGGSQERLAAIMARLRRETDKLLIMTTREYLFRDASRTIDRIRETNMELLKISVEVSAYTLMQKAQMLFNHLRWRDEVLHEDLQYFVKSKGYYAIINHHNFNPRLMVDTLDRMFPTKVASAGLS